MKGSEQDLVRIDASRRIRPDRSNPNVLEAALAYATEAEGIATGIYPLGRSLGKSREPLRRRRRVRDARRDQRRSAGRRLPGRAGLRRQHQQRRAARRDPAPVRREPRAGAQGLARATPFAWNGKFTSTPRSTSGRARCSSRHPPGSSPASATRARWSSASSAASASTTSAGSAPRSPDGGSSTASGRSPNRLGKDDNPYRLGFMQTICVADTDAKAEELYAARRVLLPEGHRVHPDGAAVRCPAASTSRACSSSSATPATSGSTRGCARRASPSSSTPDR